MCNFLLSQSLVLHPLPQSFKIADEISVLCVLTFKRLDRQTDRQTAECSELKVRNFTPHLISY